MNYDLITSILLDYWWAALIIIGGAAVMFYLNQQKKYPLNAVIYERRKNNEIVVRLDHFGKFKGKWKGKNIKDVPESLYNYLEHQKDYAHLKMDQGLLSEAPIKNMMLTSLKDATPIDVDNLNTARVETRAAIQRRKPKKSDIAYWGPIVATAAVAILFLIGMYFSYGHLEKLVSEAASACNNKLAEINTVPAATNPINLLNPNP